MANTFRRHIDIFECKDADDLLDHLRPRLQRDRRDDFIYRGIGDAEQHRLIPRALRTDVLATAAPVASSVHFFELKELREFVTACDRCGLRVPDDGQELRQSLDVGHLQRHSRWPQRTWPLKEHFAVWAVAQHHGLRTRLLDWSRNPLVAAYFAAVSCLETPREHRAKHIAVWMLDRLGAIVWGEHLAIVEIPAAHSPNLAAQAGLFTVTITAEGPGDPVQVPRSVEDIIAGCTYEMGMPRPSVPGKPVDLVDRPEVLLFKYTLPVEHAADVLRLCRQYGVSGATMFPGYDGAAREVREVRLCFEEYQATHSRP